MFSSPDVVQEIVEDSSTVAYLVRLGQSPAKDGVSLADQKMENGVCTNGVVNGVPPKILGDTPPQNGTQVNGTINKPPLATIKTPDLPIVDQTKPSPVQQHSTSTLPPQQIDSSAIKLDTKLHGGVKSNVEESAFFFRCQIREQIGN
jgi:hypothetical protein